MDQIDHAHGEKNGERNRGRETESPILYLISFDSIPTTSINNRVECYVQYSTRNPASPDLLKRSRLVLSYSNHVLPVDLSPRKIN